MLDLKEFEGLNTYDVNGYIAYYIPTHRLANKSGKVYQHMIVAEQMLGRELKSEEVVHHKDRNRHNNSFENLMIFKTGADHAAFHAGGEVIKDGDVYIATRKPRTRTKSSNLKKYYYTDVCPLCGKQMAVNAKMCMNCRNEERAKNIPPKEELYNLLKDKSMCAIGKIYNVSDNAVRKWCVKYGLPFNKDDIIKFREKEFGIVKEIKERQEPTPYKSVDMYSINNDFIESFISIGKAAEYIIESGQNKYTKKDKSGIRHHIAETCNNNRKTAYGYKWRWHEELTDELAS